VVTLDVFVNRDYFNSASSAFDTRLVVIWSASPPFAQMEHFTPLLCALRRTYDALHSHGFTSRGPPVFFLNNRHRAYPGNSIYK